MDTEKENSNSNTQNVNINNNKSYKTHFVVTLIILIGLIVYMVFFSESSRDLKFSIKRPVPDFSTGEIKTTVVTKDGVTIEVTSKKDEKGNEEIKAKTIQDGGMVIKLDSNDKEGEKNVQVNVD